MSLKSYFPEQFDQIKAFLISATEVVRCLMVDPEMKPMLIKALVKMEEHPDFPHAFVICTEKFTEPARYFDHLFTLVSRSYEQNAVALREQHVEFKTPFEPDTRLDIPAKFISYASTLSNSLPDRFGSLVFVIDPEEVSDPNSYRKSILYLAEHTQSNWLKYLVFDSRTTPLLQDIEKEDSRIGVQTFYLSPAEIEKRVSDDLQSPAAMSPVEQRQYKGLLAGFAFARKEYDQAAKLQQAWAIEAENNEQPAEAANAYYNLGNTLLARGDFDHATNVFCKVCDLCVEHKVNGLAPFAYTNLGVSLHGQGQIEQAFASLKVAGDMFKAQNQRAGEAYVADCQAKMHALDGHNDEAEKTWRYALSLYDDMTSSMFKDLRDSGRKDILAKIGQLNVHAEQDKAESGESHSQADSS